MNGRQDQNKRLSSLGKKLAYLVPLIVTVVAAYFGALAVPEFGRCFGFEPGGSTHPLCPYKPTKNQAAPPQFPLETGSYSAQGSLYHNSWQEIASTPNRSCIVQVAGPTNAFTEGNLQTTISSISWRDGDFYVDATGLAISIHSSTSFRDGFGPDIWHHQTSRLGHIDQLNQCLSSKDKYVKTEIEKTFVPKRAQ